MGSELYRFEPTGEVRVPVHFTLPTEPGFYFTGIYTYELDKDGFWSKLLDRIPKEAIPPRVMRGYRWFVGPLPKNVDDACRVPIDAADVSAACEPITDEWLESIGFTSDDEANMHFVYGPKFIPFYRSWDDGLWYFGALEIKQPNTPADVLAMLAAIGVSPTQEQPHA